MADVATMWDVRVLHEAHKQIIMEGGPVKLDEERNSIEFIDFQIAPVSKITLYRLSLSAYEVIAKTLPQ